jgi:signal peptidase II
VSKWALAASIALAVIVLDQVTKLAVVRSMDLHESIPLIDGLFSLTYVRNTGAAFGLLAGRMEAVRVPFFLLVSAGAVVLLGFFLRSLADDRRWMAVACGCVAGGALGNMIDRVFLGEVIDFLDVYVRDWHWPAFNVADMAITIGVAFLALDSVSNEETLSPHPGERSNEETLSPRPDEQSPPGPHSSAR